MNANTTDLDDAEAPEHVGAILRCAAQRFYESQSELQAAWQDKNAGYAWSKIARILERAADQCDKAAL